MFNNMIVSWSNVHDTDIPMPQALEEWLTFHRTANFEPPSAMTNWI